MYLEIKALDTLFFNDGKSFNSGEDNTGTSSFPPAPSVFYGALRSLYFSQNPQKLKDANTDKDPTKDLSIKGIYYRINNDVYLPLPLDIVENKNDDNDDKENFLLDIRKVEGISNKAVDYILSKDKEVEQIKGGLIPLYTMEVSYLFESKSIRERFPKDTIVKNYVITKNKKKINVLKDEVKTGIGINSDSGTTQKGMLYRYNMKRYNGSFIIDVDNLNLDIQDDLLIKLGGENKLAKVDKADFKNLENLKIETFKDLKLELGKKLKVILLTPSIFNSGVFPEFIEQRELEGIKFKLKTYSVGKPFKIGGFDIKENKPKTMYTCVPSGSVYYIELEDENQKEEFINKVYLKSISDIKAEEGFGLCIIGGWNE